MAFGQSPSVPTASSAATMPSSFPATVAGQWLADAGLVPSDLSAAFPADSLWASRLLFTFNSLALPLTLWFKPLCVLVALIWLVTCDMIKPPLPADSHTSRLIWRALQVMNKPLDELALLLGFDIPPTPSVDLASVKADGALIHWSLTEKHKQKNSLKYEIHLNGAAIDAVSVHETAVTITGLHPGTYYVVRVALVNSLDFSSKSEPLRFCTKPAASGDFFVVAVDGHETDHEGPHDPVPRIRPYRGLKDIAPAVPLASAASRESGVGLAPRRLTNGRRMSPSAVEIKHELAAVDNEARESAETIQLLTERLDAIRRETDEADKLAKEEDEEERKQKDELIKERDELKAEVVEKEKASRNLKREVNVLERQNTAAQNERAKQERLLAQKKQERQKLQDELVRWKREAEEMTAEVVRLQQEQADHLQTVSQKKENLRRKHADKAANLQALDNEVKEKTAEVKKLERSLKNSSPNGVETGLSLVQQYQQDADDERAWQAHRHSLQMQYTNAYQKMDDAKRFHTEQMRYLESLRSERRRAEELAQFTSLAPAQDRAPRRSDGQTNRPHRHSSSDSPRLASFPLNQSSFSNSMTNIAPSAFSAAPFLNIQNGMTIAGPTETMALSDEEKDKLTGGAPMSPGAGAELIPADLFSGETDHRMDRVPPLPGLGALPGLAGLAGAPLPYSQDFMSGGPASPTSVSSRSPSVFASPRESSQNLHMGSPDNFMDADRRSIRSTRSTRATSGTGSRFSALFNRKPRAKTTSEEGPALNKASSMPRQDQGIPGLDSKSRKRNSSISGTVGTQPFSIDGTTEDFAESSATAPSKRFGLFSRDKSGGWPSTFTSFGRRPTSPRPGSTHSIELPRPSADTSRWGVDTWPSTDAGSVANRSSPLGFGQGWNVPGQQPRLYGSRLSSRRPSVQYNASAPPADIIEADDDDASDVLTPDQESHLPPIGTKPSSSFKKQAENLALLNPNAKDFKSFFSKLKSKDSTPTSDKVMTPGSSTTATLLPNPEHEESPPNSRKSRDTRSLNTNESSLAESNRNSADLVRTPSFSTSDAPMPSPSLATSSKESFMSKLTPKISRKPSSGKFSLPTFRQKPRLDASAGSPSIGSTAGPATPGAAPAEDEEDGLSTSVGSVKDRDSLRSSARWSSVLKLGKSSSSKKSIDAPSLSGLSLTSGTEDGEGETGEDEE